MLKVTVGVELACQHITSPQHNVVLSGSQSIHHVILWDQADHLQHILHIYIALINYYGLPLINTYWRNDPSWYIAVHSHCMKIHFSRLAMYNMIKGHQSLLISWYCVNFASLIGKMTQWQEFSQRNQKEGKVDRRRIIKIQEPAGWPLTHWVGESASRRRQYLTLSTELRERVHSTTISVIALVPLSLSLAVRHSEIRQQDASNASTVDRRWWDLGCCSPELH